MSCASSAWKRTWQLSSTKAKMLVGSYELEQRMQPLEIRTDELRWRIVAMEDQVFGYNLDRALMTSHLVVRREP